MHIINNYAHGNNYAHNYAHRSGRRTPSDLKRLGIGGQNLQWNNFRTFHIDYIEYRSPLRQERIKPLILSWLRLRQLLANIHLHTEDPLYIWNALTPYYQSERRYLRKV